MHANRARAWGLALLLGACCAAVPIADPSAARAAPVGLAEFSIPTPNAAPGGIALGSDGNMWFTERAADQIGRVTPDGVVSEFPLGGGSHGPTAIAAGPDGALWFTQSASGAIGRITTDGEVTEFHVGSASTDIVLGPDGNLWFSEDSSAIGRITPAGAVTHFPVPALGELVGHTGITVGPDGNIWFSAPTYVGRLGLDGGLLSTFPIANKYFFPGGIASGPDGAVWLTEGTAWSIGRITPSGESTEFRLVGESSPNDITTGPEGSIWYSGTSGGKAPGAGFIGRRSPAGKSRGSFRTSMEPSAIATGPEGGIWFTQETLPVGSTEHRLVGRLLPPPFIEATLTRRLGSVRRGWSRVGVRCTSDDPDASCRGTLSLRLPRRPREGVSGGPPRRRRLIARREFFLRAGRSHRFALRLRRAARDALVRRGGFQVVGAANLRKGTGDLTKTRLRPAPAHPRRFGHSG